jgi:hypothetical protein
VQTIKTQLVDGQQRVITKLVDGQQRVSCSCCEFVECCMYRSDVLGDIYSEDDLPDAVTVYWADQFTGSLGKNGSTYESGPVSLFISNGTWRLKDTSADPEAILTVGKCLIVGDGNLTAGNDLVEDQFADTYGIATISGDYYAPTVTRTGLCTWVGIGPEENPESDVFLFYWNGVNDFLVPDVEGVPQHGWHLYVGVPFGSRKIGSQNTPVGTYFGGDATVFEL